MWAANCGHYMGRTIVETEEKKDKSSRLMSTRGFNKWCRRNESWSLYTSQGLGLNFDEFAFIFPRRCSNRRHGAGACRQSARRTVPLFDRAAESSATTCGALLSRGTRADKLNSTVYSQPALCRRQPRRARVAHSRIAPDVVLGCVETAAA